MWCYHQTDRPGISPGVGGGGFHSGLHNFDVSTQTDYLWAGRDAAGDETGQKMMNRFHRSWVTETGHLTRKLWSGKMSKYSVWVWGYRWDNLDVVAQSCRWAGRDEISPDSSYSREKKKSSNAEILLLRRRCSCKKMRSRNEKISCRLKQVYCNGAGAGWKKTTRSAGSTFPTVTPRIPGKTDCSSHIFCIPIYADTKRTNGLPNANILDNI